MKKIIVPNRSWIGRLILLIVIVFLISHWRTDWSHASTATSKSNTDLVTLTVVNFVPLSLPIIGAHVEAWNSMKETCVLKGLTLKTKNGEPKTVSTMRPVPIFPGKSRIFYVEGLYDELLGIEKGDVRAICSDEAKTVGGLRGILDAASYVVKSGEDILVAFLLEAPLATDEKPVIIWDTKYSAGYRSWSFRVKTPGGKIITLEREVVDSWDKNAPHPVDITGDKPYFMEGWGVQHGVEKNGIYYFSLKRLGLDTSEMGDYRITGFFSQKGGDGITEEKTGKTFFSGDLETNTIIVTVN